MAINHYSRVHFVSMKKKKNLTAIFASLSISIFLIMIFKDDYESSSLNETFTFVRNCNCYD